MSEPKILTFLFPRSVSTKFSLFLLALRVLFGTLLLLHGIGKWCAYAALSETFPDPLGLGVRFSLLSAILVEVFCSIAFIFGLFYRLCMVPMIFTVGTAFFFVHRADIGAGELAFVYFAVFVAMYLSGPGMFSLDSVIGSLLRHSRKEKQAEIVPLSDVPNQ